MKKWCMGIDLGGTFIKFGLLDSGRRPSGLFQLPTPNDRGADGVVGQIVAGAKQMMSQHGLSRSDVVGVGIGSPGPLKISEGVIIGMPNIPGMDNVPLRDRVSQALSLPGVLENDANAAAYGEYLCGAGQGTRQLVMITLGTGVGSGVILNGEILHGAHEIGAEIGHMIVEPDGEPCGCGQRGCLEQYASATSMAGYACRLISQGHSSILQEAMERKGEIDAKDIHDARKAGDPLAAEVWDRAARYLAIGCVSICRIFDPDEIVLTGGLTRAGDDLLQPVGEYFRKLHWKLTDPMTQVVASKLGGDAGVIGAAGVAWRAFGAVSATPAQATGR